MRSIVSIDNIKKDIYADVKQRFDTGKKEYTLKEEFFKRVNDIKEDINSRTEKPVVYDWVQYQKKTENEYIYDNLLDIRYKFTTKLDLLPMYDRSNVLRGSKTMNFEVVWENISRRFESTLSEFVYNSKNGTITKTLKATHINNRTLNMYTVIRNINFINYVLGRPALTEEEQKKIYDNEYITGKKYQIGDLHFRAYKNKKFVIYLRGRG